MHKNASPQHAFFVRAGFLGNSLTGEVLDIDHNLQTFQLGLLESEARRQANRRGGHAFAGLWGAHPVAEIGETVGRVKMVQAHTTENPPRLGVDDDKLKFALR